MNEYERIERILYLIDDHISASEALLNKANADLEVDFYQFVAIRLKMRSVLTHGKCLTDRLNDLHKTMCRYRGED